MDGTPERFIKCKVTNKNPTVTVLMPVFNAMPYVVEASQSILTQTYRDFEFLIIDDGSTDGSYEYLSSLADDRIRLVRHETNKGIGQTLQSGIKNSRGTYILRMDADDIAKPHRIQVQVNYLEQNPDIGLLGASYDSIDEKGIKIESTVKDEADLNIRWKCFFKNPFVHATVAIRKAILEKNNLNYPDSLNQDYFLWTDMLRHTKGSIISSSVLLHRKHIGSLTQTRAAMKKELQLKHGYSLFTELMGDYALQKNEFSDFIEWYNMGVSYPFFKEVKFITTVKNMLRRFMLRYIGNEVGSRLFFKRELSKALSKASGNKLQKLFLKIMLLPDFYLGYILISYKISK